MAQSILITADGTIDATAWIDYWSALWSAPTQPGYAQVVRESLARLVQFASHLETIAKTGPPGATNDSLAAEARSIATAFGGYGLLAFTSNDGPTLQTRIVNPLLFNADNPLWQVRKLQAKIAVTSGIIAPDWSTTLRREIVEPLARPLAQGMSLVTAAAVIIGVIFLMRFLPEGGAST